MGAESVHRDDLVGAIRLVLHLARADRRRWKEWERATGKRLAKLTRQAEREFAAHPLALDS